MGGFDYTTLLYATLKSIGGVSFDSVYFHINEVQILSRSFVVALLAQLASSFFVCVVQQHSTSSAVKAAAAC
jgi:hypothetical protein